MELVDTDVMEPFSVDELLVGGNSPGSCMRKDMRWVVNLIDDYTGYAEAIPVQTKGQAAGTVVDHMHIVQPGCLVVLQEVSVILCRWNERTVAGFFGHAEVCTEYE